MPGSPLLDLQRYGQSIWYDFIRRSLITSGELQDLIDRDGVRGVTSNPVIFEKAIAGSTDYDDAIRDILRRGDPPAQGIYEHLAIDDIRSAADLLSSVHKSSGGRDGYVSLEVSPHLAYETEATVVEAKRLWAAVDRPNLMIKVPATAAGLPAICSLLGEGVNINVTLLFAREIYEAVAEAYIAALENRAAAGRNVAGVASVASFFVSRIDSLIDSLIDERLASTAAADARGVLTNLLGKVAIANAKLAYVAYRRIFSGERWQALAARGGQTQRLLWASTGTKNPNYPKTMYVDELIGPDTVNTVPPDALAHFREHGRVRQSLTEGIEEARDTLARLAASGISMEDVTRRLLDQGVKLFADGFDKLLGAIEQKRRAVLGTRVG
jgi:transaldolase